MSTDKSHVKELQKEMIRVRKHLKDWEHYFEIKHKHKPTVENIAERPKVEKVYKEYNRLKKQFKQAIAATKSAHASSQPDLLGSSSQASHSCHASPSSSRRGSSMSIEFVRSPTPRSWSRRMSQSQSSPSSRSRKEAADSVRPREEDEGDDQLLKSDADFSPAAQDAFWMDDSSQKSLLESDSQKSFPEASSQESLSSSQSSVRRRRKKNVALEQKLFGHLIYKPQHTFTQPTQSMRVTATAAEISPILPSSLPRFPATPELTSEPDSPEEFTIETRILDPLRHYDASLFNWNDPDFFVPAGLFASVRARTTVTTPLLNEPKRRARVLKELQQGTLGEKKKRDDLANLDDELQRFIQENSQPDREPFATASAEEPSSIYVKKPIQKRQTRLYKLKFVDTV
ncbi:uncharacterized protein BYT42DRAFT_616649 [Radiomyces spectabilis]|uniref:uncharacterized protein n=1 Tax=Radiomyces spectabilis TaxID=64574 RepID=UPI0022206275|nr:uncharacterized protein BYT42DRAFT_616649 [Radiomyces spectabilis]KAI8371564.1 hypothetical protein BYT42DRAFT_616649 [Radiomyces spectabilis]